MDIGTEVSIVAAALAAVGAALAYWQAYLARRSNKLADRSIELASRSHALDTYDRAVHAILDLKADFDNHPDIFADQFADPDITARYEHSGIRAEEFLLFARGMWRLSYAYSVQSNKELRGLRPSEMKALRREVKLWVLLPGFKWIFEHFAKKLNVHNEEFLMVLQLFYDGKDEDADLNLKQVADVAMRLFHTNLDQSGKPRLQSRSHAIGARLLRLKQQIADIPLSLRGR